MRMMVRDILKLARCETQYRADQLASLDLKSCHISYLAEVCLAPGITQDQLSRRICINKSNVARQLAVLEEAGYVTRIPSPEDKRALLLYPTEKAREMLPKIDEMMRWWDDYLTQDLSAEEMETLRSGLSKMLARASAWMEER